MIISDSRRFCFIHVPKCAGITIRTSLMRYETRNNFFWGHEDMPAPEPNSLSNNLFLDKAHMTLPILKHFYPDEFNLLNEYTTFAITRHPRARLISAFFMVRPGLLKLAQAPSADDIKVLKNKFSNYVSNIVSTANFLQLAYVHATPQIDYHNMGVKSFIDVVIKLESPLDGIQKLKMLNPDLGFTCELALQTQKENDQKGIHSLQLWESLSPALKEKCASFYDEDCKYFGYNFFDQSF